MSCRPCIDATTSIPAGQTVLHAPHLVQNSRPASMAEDARPPEDSSTSMYVASATDIAGPAKPTGLVMSTEGQTATQEKHLIHVAALSARARSLSVAARRRRSGSSEVEGSRSSIFLS